MLHIPSLYINDSDLGGKGVFSAEEILKGDIIEICPIIILSKGDTALIHQTLLHDYYFKWKEEMSAILLGYGSIYNHSDHPNAYFEANIHQKDFVFSSIKNISAGDEILINYRDGEPDMKLWF